MTIKGPFHHELSRPSFTFRSESPTAICWRQPNGCNERRAAALSAFRKNLETL